MQLTESSVSPTLGGGAFNRAIGVAANGFSDGARFVRMGRREDPGLSRNQQLGGRPKDSRLGPSTRRNLRFRPKRSVPAVSPDR